MKNTATISLDLINNNQHEDLTLTVKIDSAEVYSNKAPTGCTSVEHTVSNDQEHTLEIVLSDKKTEHTRIDSEGNIVSDSLLNIENICVDGVDISELVHKNSAYLHNTNGTTEEFEDIFVGIMGCNGTVSFKFACPIQDWILKNQ